MKASVEVLWHQHLPLLLTELLLHLVFLLSLSLLLVLGDPHNPSLQAAAQAFPHLPSLLLSLTLLSYIPLLLRHLPLPLFTDRRLLPRARYLLHLLLLLLLLLVVTTRPYSPGASYPSQVLALQ